VWTGTPTIFGWPGCTPEWARAEIQTPENRKAAREIAEQSFVLLKNDRQILPLRKSGVIALVGPLVADQQNLPGCHRAAGDWRQAVSDETLLASVDVTNTGKRAGEETVQLYLSQPVASVTRSVEDLRGFQKIRLQPGETRQVTFRITPEDLKFYNSNLEYDWEPGEFIIRIGGSSSQLKSAPLIWNRQAVPAQSE